MSKKRIVSIATALIMCFLFVLFCACGKSDSYFKEYKSYVAYAEEQGDTVLSYEEWLASIKGEKGDKGDKGDQGAKGDKGDKGDKGEKGDQGDKGDDGEQGIRGETGAKGDKGDQGLKGDKGDQGQQGVRGESAFEIFKKYYEYEGTEKEWIDDIIYGKWMSVCVVQFVIPAVQMDLVKPVIVLKNHLLEEPTYPLDPSVYESDGWYTDAEFTSRWNFETDKVQSDMTLYLKTIYHEPASK